MTAATYEITVVGAGFAGTCMVHKLLQAGVPTSSMLWLDANEPGKGASGGPGLLMNPLPGRTLYPKPGYPEAFASSASWLRELREPSWLVEAPLLRPLRPDHAMSKRLRRSFDRALPVLPDSLQIKLLSESEAKHICPGFGDIIGAIQIDPAFGIWPAPLFRRLNEQLHKKGMVCQSQTALQSLTQHTNDQAQQWTLHTNKGAFRTRRVVLAVGAGLLDLFPTLPLDAVGGALLAVSPPSSASLSCLVSGIGIHMVPRQDGQWIIGATYDPPDKTPLTDQESIDLLLSRMADIFPSIHECQVEQLWRNIRVVDPDTRMPIAGPLQGHPGVWVLGAFGSKGLLMIPHMAQQVLSSLL